MYTREEGARLWTSLRALSCTPSPPNKERWTPVFTSTLIGYAPHALDLEETRVVTPIATPDFTGAITTTVTSISSGVTNFIALAWPALLGLILLILLIIVAVRIGLGATRKLGGLGRRA